MTKNQEHEWKEELTNLRSDAKNFRIRESTNQREKIMSNKQKIVRIENCV